ncbi:hypothetical protein NP234_23960 [Salmonella enterica]|nr:hypothetical protein [Salmonella enterica]
MQFQRNEFAAIVKLAMAMTGADGIFVESEKKAMSFELLRFGVTKSDLPALLSDARAMESHESIRVISGLDADRKKYVAAFLGELMVIDGEIAPAEMKLWRLTTTICDLPELTIEEAVDYMASLV